MWKISLKFKIKLQNSPCFFNALIKAKVFEETKTKIFLKLKESFR